MTGASLPATQRSDRFYPIRRPIAAFLSGTCVAVLAGLIGLGGAEFRLPLLIMVFGLFAHRAVRINLLISLATLAAASLVRLRVLSATPAGLDWVEIAAMSMSGVAAAWIGAGVLGHIRKDRVLPMIAILLALTAAFLLGETLLQGVVFTLPENLMVRVVTALMAGAVIGAISSLLGVAGGEFIIPTLVLLFGMDIKLAGTASVLISVPIVLSGVARHFFAGKYRSRTMLAFLVLPMSLGSITGATLGGYISTGIPDGGLRILLAGVLIVSAVKLWRK